MLLISSDLSRELVREVSLAVGDALRVSVAVADVVVVGRVVSIVHVDGSSPDASAIAPWAVVAWVPWPVVARVASIVCSQHVGVTGSVWCVLYMLVRDAKGRKKEASKVMCMTLIQRKIQIHIIDKYIFV